jgi:hypothetical protein
VASRGICGAQIFNHGWTRNFNAEVAEKAERRKREQDRTKKLNQGFLQAERRKRIVCFCNMGFFGTLALVPGLEVLNERILCVAFLSLSYR